MMSNQQKAIVMKDIRSIVANRRYFWMLTLFPLLFSIVFPSIFILTILLVPIDSASVQQFAAILPDYQMMDAQKLIAELLNLIINNVLPLFFLMIPIMVSTVMAASSFVGEKEKRTLETLFYSPLSIKQIFQAKVYAAFTIGVVITYLSFLIMAIVVEIEIFIINGAFFLPSINWLLILLLFVPAIAMIAIILIVKGSAKSNSMEEAQQKAAFLILPLVLMLIGQFTGILLISSWMLLVLGLVLAAISFILIRNAMKGFTYEALLK